jgi:hypothetical protein
LKFSASPDCLVTGPILAAALSNIISHIFAVSVDLG